MPEETTTCTLRQFERNHYFYGKLMTVRDFQNEQRYLIEKNRLLNRLIHGVGIVCGLEATEPELEDETFTIQLAEGGALDCCGREIVVDKTQRVEVKGDRVPGRNYVYLTYRECQKEPVPSPANASTCEETCCYSRIQESYEVIVSAAPPRETDREIEGTVMVADSDTPLAGAKIEAMQNGIVKNATMTNRAGTFTLDLQSEAYTLRVSAHGFRPQNREISAAIDGEIDEFLLERAEELPNPRETCQNIKNESYAAHLLACPECQEPRVLLAVVDITEGDVVLEEEATNDYRSIVYNNPLLADIFCDHLADVNNPHDTTAAQTGAIVSINEIENPGGNIWIREGDNVTIENNSADHTITINSEAVAIEPADSVQSVRQNKRTGESEAYAREDHVHDIGVGAVQEENLSKPLLSQLHAVFTYLRERALKCTVMSFRQLNQEFPNSATARAIAAFAKDAVDDKAYAEEATFARVIEDILERLLSDRFKEEIEPSAVGETWEDFLKAVEGLQEAVESGEALGMAAAQDEVCFYAALIRRVVVD